MTHVIVEWGRRNRRTVTTLVELDALLDEIEKLRGDFDTPYMATLFREPRDGTALQIGLGHPERSFMLRMGDDSTYAVDPALPELDDALDWDYGGQATEYPPKWTRFTPAAARTAAREYVRTAQLQHA